MKTTSNSTINKVSRLLLAFAFVSLVVTGCSSTQSGSFSEASGSATVGRLAYNGTRATVGNLVALKHNGTTIYVSEHAVADHLSRGDTLAVNQDGKTVYSDEQELQQYLAK